MIVYGRNPVREALRGPREVTRVWATENAAGAEWLSGVATLAASAGDIEHRCGSPDHQGICAQVSPYAYADATDLVEIPAPLIVVLDQVQDPQNLGAICRTAECAGASGVVIPERRAAEVSPAVCKASAGAVEHLPIARVRNVSDFLAECKEAGIWCYGADASSPISYESVDYRGGVALALGSEGRGLRPRVASTCDALVSLPLRGKVESLSVASAAAILLYAAARGRPDGIASS